MKQLIFVMLFVALQSCNNSMVELGQSFTFKDSGFEKMFIPSGELVSKIDTTINQIEYTLGVKNNAIVFISSKDGDATEIRGVKSKELTELRGENNSLQKINGWGYYLSVGNEWFAGYDEGSTINDNKKPDWFFKYNFPKENVNKFKSITND